MIFSGTVRIHHLPNMTHSWIPAPNSSATNMTQLAPYHGTVTVNTQLLLIISGSAMDDSPDNYHGRACGIGKLIAEAPVLASQRGRWQEFGVEYQERSKSTD